MLQEQRAVEESIVERGLECVIGERHIIVPLRFVDQLIEYPRASLPLARDGIAGLGVYQGELLISLSLDTTKSPGIATKAVLLRPLVPAVTFALEVDRTLSFVDLSAGAATDQAPPPDPWLSFMTSADGRHLLRLDVESLISVYFAEKGRI